MSLKYEPSSEPLHPLDESFGVWEGFFWKIVQGSLKDGVSQHGPQILHGQPTLNPRPETRNPKLQTLKHSTLNPRPETRHPKPETLNPETLNTQP